MSQENIDAIKRGIEAFNRGDWDAAADGLAEDAVWTAYLASVDGAKSLFGREAIKRAWEAQADALGGEDFKVEARDIRDLGAGTLLVPIRVSGRGTASGVPTQAEYVQLWTLREGLAVRIDNYADATEALEAAGLRK